jgi:hypothetical protein
VTVTSALVWIVVVTVAVLLVVLAIREREKGVRDRGQASALLRAGMMEAQNLLEPDRKIEIVRQAERREDLLVAEDRSGEPPGEPPPRGEGSR